MSRLGSAAVLRLDGLRDVVWSTARRPFVAVAGAIAAGKLSLKLAETRIRRRVEATVRDVLFIVAFAAVGSALALAGGVLLLMAIWGALAAYLGPNGASLWLGIALLVASMVPLALAAARATRRPRLRD
jgi:hypothetical protein